jgi:glycerol-3-phosphate dehydrogenase
MKVFDREILLKELKEEVIWDLVIIGGGATGLGIAVDASSRGFKTLLIEQDDFAKGTSSRSTKLVHGGVRYLAQGNISLVKEALKERGLLLQNAPHLTKNESIIIPCYSWMKTIFYATGLTFYDWLSGSLSLGKSKIIFKKELTRRLPTLKKDSLKSGVLYHDGTFDDSRLAINLAQTCVDNGGVALNYCKVVSLMKSGDNKISGANVLDKETGDIFEIKAKVVVNATGVFVDDIIKMDNAGSKSLIRPSQGIHLVLDRSFLKSKDAIMIPHTDDGRVLFAIPWYDKVLIGTTDTPLNNHSLEPRALESEIEFVLNTAGKYLSKKPQKEDVLSVFAGLRPLAATDDGNEKTKEISRSHKVIISESGLVSVIGGKWTTYRKMAEDTISKIMRRKMLPDKKCITEDLKIHGYSTENSGGLLSYYGADQMKLVELIGSDKSFAEPLNSQTNILVAQVVWAVRNEMARTVEDFLARRTRVLFTDAKLAIKLTARVAEIMMKELNENEAWKENQIQTFSELAKGYLLESDLNSVKQHSTDMKVKRSKAND